MYKGFWWGGEPEGKRTIGKPRRRWEDNIKMDVEIFYYQLMHITLKNTELLKHSKITLPEDGFYVNRNMLERNFRMF